MNAKNLRTLGLKRPILDPWKRLEFTSTRPIQQSETKQFKDIPGPKSYPFFENLFSIKKYGGHLDPTLPGFYFELQKQYGNLVKFGLARKPEIFVYDPESIEKVFKFHDKEPGKKKFEPWIMYFNQVNKPQSLSNSDGPRWRKLRTAMNPVLSAPKAVAKNINSQEKISDEMVGFIDWKIGQNPDKSTIFDDFEKRIVFLSLEFVSHVAFGKKIVAFDDRLRPKETDEFAEALDKFLLTMSALMGSVPIWKHVRTKKWNDFKHWTEKLLKFTEFYINDSFRGLENTENNSLVKYLHDKKTKYGINDDDIHSVVSELFTGGIETVSTTMHFTLFQLGSERGLQEEIYSEINQVLKPGERINEDTLAQVKLLKAFVKEVLRYYPIVLAVGRELKEDMVLHGYKIPKGTFINVISGVTSRLESVFDNASKFDPHRWLDGDKNYHPFGMVPFGYGVRNCVARRLAEQELYISLIKLIQNYEIEYVGEPFGYTNSVFSGPDKPLRLKFTKRSK